MSSREQPPVTEKRLPLKKDGTPDFSKMTRGEVTYWANFLDDERFVEGARAAGLTLEEYHEIGIANAKVIKPPNSQAEGHKDGDKK